MYVNYDHDPVIFTFNFVGKVILYVVLGILVPQAFWLIYDSYMGDAYKARKSNDKKDVVLKFYLLASLFFGGYDLYLAGYSLFEYGAGSSCPLSHLTKMTETQALLLEVVLFWDCFDIGLLLGHGVTTVPLQELLLHHIPSIIGIGYQLCNNVGGGLMALFLLDGTTHMVSVFEDLLKGTTFIKLRIARFNYKTVYDLIQEAYWSAYLLTRIITYTWGSLQIVYVILTYNLSMSYCSIDNTWSVLIFLWISYANYDHWTTLIEYIQQRDIHLFAVLKRVKIGTLVTRYQKPSL